MKKLTLKEIKMKEVDILLALQEFCHNNNLCYYLSGGTLLGAIRHKGFIPWDDDIDVCMPRPDYEKFVCSFVSKSKNFKIRSSGLHGFNAPFTKIIDDNTIIKSKYSDNDISLQLWVDVFPIDGLPSDIFMVKKIYHSCEFYRRVYLLTEARLGEGKTCFRKYSKYILKPLANLYGKKRCVQHIERIAQQYQYESSDYVGAITWGLYGAGERMLKSEFEKSVEVVFEDHVFPTFSCWDNYLKNLYGDYMQLPPIQKRKTHDMKVYVKD